MSQPFEEIVCRCVRCNSGFTAAQIVGATGCPNCGSHAIPSNPKQDAMISVNVHELRILGIWAENHAVAEDNKHLDDAHREQMKDTVNAICDRIRAQLAAQGLDAPLTLSAEMKQLQAAGIEATLFRDGREEP